MQVKGKLKMIGNTVAVSDKFKKREFALTIEEGDYPQHRLYQLTQDKVSLLDGYNLGDTIEVSVNFRGREWTSPTGEVKYFNTDEVWKIERVGQAPEPLEPIGNFLDEEPPF